MSMRSNLQAAAFLVAALQAGPAGACFFHALGNEGLTPPHPGALKVAVALNKAQNEGILEALPENRDARFGNLWLLSRKVGSHIDRLAAKGAEGPPFTVLLTQSGAWLRMNDPEKGAVFHADPPKQGEPVILIPDTAYRALLDGKLTIRTLRDAGLLRIFADDENAVLVEFDRAFPASAGL